MNLLLVNTSLKMVMFAKYYIAFKHELMESKYLSTEKNVKMNFLRFSDVGGLI